MSGGLSNLLMDSQAVFYIELCGAVRCYCETDKIRNVGPALLKLTGLITGRMSP